MDENLFIHFYALVKLVWLIYIKKRTAGVMKNLTSLSNDNCNNFYQFYSFR